MYKSKGYKLDELKRIRVDTAKTANFEDLWNCLRSKNEALCANVFPDDPNEDIFINNKAKKTVSNCN